MAKLMQLSSVKAQSERGAAPAAWAELQAELSGIDVSGGNRFNP